MRGWSEAVVSHGQTARTEPGPPGMWQHVGEGKGGPRSVAAGERIAHGMSMVRFGVVGEVKGSPWMFT